jgi:hypothetical protein
VNSTKKEKEDASWKALHFHAPFPCPCGISVRIESSEHGSQQLFCKRDQ